MHAAFTKTIVNPRGGLMNNTQTHCTILHYAQIIKWNAGAVYCR